MKHLYLRNLNFSTNLGSELSALLRFNLQSQPAQATADRCELPTPLGIMTDRTALEDRFVKTRTLQFGRSGNQWTINGQTWNPNHVELNPGQCDIFEVGTGRTDPLSDRAKLLPAPPLGLLSPPLLIEDIPCKCFEPLPNSCNIAIEPPEDCKMVSTS